MKKWSGVLSGVVIRGVGALVFDLRVFVCACVVRKSVTVIANRCVFINLSETIPSMVSIV